MNYRKFFAVAFLVLMTGCQTIPETAVVLSGNSINSAINGNTAYGEFNDRSKWVEHYLEDGRLVYEDAQAKKAGTKLYGVWRIEGDLFCTRYISDELDEEYCWNIYKDGSEYLGVAMYAQDMGQIRWRIYDIKQGDPENLFSN